MFRGCPKAFHNNYNCINHIGVIYPYLFGDTLSKTPFWRHPSLMELLTIFHCVQLYLT